MEAEIMPDGFSPRRRGRKPSYDISEVLEDMSQHPGKWLKYTLSRLDANSARRQFARMDIDTAVDTIDDETSTLYVRSK